MVQSPIIDDCAIKNDYSVNKFVVLLILRCDVLLFSFIVCMLLQCSQLLYRLKGKTLVLG